MVHHIPHPVSEGMRKENEVHRQRVAHLDAAQIRALYPTAEAFCRYYSNSAEGAQLREALEGVHPGATVLDVGAGYGIIAVFLASLGYRVTAVEPSPDLCAYVERAAQLYGLELPIYNASAECLDCLPARDFDVCMFNASLHHCDNPAQALTNCHNLLRADGKLLVMNEPLLQLFRSKAWFARQLQDGGLASGDYGGNEHTYYYHEYRAMIRRAGFAHVHDSISHRYLRPQSYFDALDCNRAGKLSRLSRRLYYGFIGQICRAGVGGKPALFLLKRLSLLQTNFTATKRAA